jgi:hypothetical protein
MRTDYASPDLDTTMAQRQVGAAQEEFVAFSSVRALTSGSGVLTTGTRSAKPASAAVNDLYFETDTRWLYYWTGTAWAFVAGLNSGTNAVRAAITVAANDNGAVFYTTDTGKLWQVSGGAWVDRFVSLDLTTSLKIAGTKVIGAQGAAVADPTGGAVIDVEARAQLALLLARCRAHGLIA